MIVGTAGHIDFTAFVRDRALSASEGEAMIQRFSLVRLPTPKSEYVITSVVWLRLENAIHTALTAFHADHPNLSGMGSNGCDCGLSRDCPRRYSARYCKGLRATRNSRSMAHESVCRIMRRGCCRLTRRCGQKSLVISAAKIVSGRHAYAISQAI
jgi:hypothetical protein